MYERSPGALSPGYRHRLEASPGDVINPGSTIEAKQARLLGKRTFRPPLPTPPPRGAQDFSIVVTTIPNSEGALKNH